MAAVKFEKIMGLIGSQRSSVVLWKQAIRERPGNHASFSRLKIEFYIRNKGWVSIFKAIPRIVMKAAANPTVP